MKCSERFLRPSLFLVLMITVLKSYLFVDISLYIIDLTLLPKFSSWTSSNFVLFVFVFGTGD